jgi:hypothetical protein
VYASRPTSVSIGIRTSLWSLVLLALDTIPRTNRKRGAVVAGSGRPAWLPPEM